MVDLAGETLAAAEVDFLRHPAVGGVILFARNYRTPAQVRELVAAIKAIRCPALLVAVDQEGGRVQRFKGGFHPLPAAGRIGEVYDRDPSRGLAMAEAAGCVMATEVLETGVDFSFAPLLDLRHPRSRVIGDRAFHAHPATVCTLAGAYIAGMQRTGMAATGKHFPGHGGVSADSHHRLPVDARPLAELAAHDLSPFAELVGQLGGVMTAHVRFAHVDEALPAWSRFWLKETLRKKLGFTGVIFSDDLSMKGAGAGDLSMKGAGAGDDLGAKSAAALNAGCDMVLICNDPDNARRTAEQLADHYPGNPTRLLCMRPKPIAPPDSAALGRMKARLRELV